MTADTAPPQARLSPAWAFVLQLREGTSFDPGELCGRIEHVSSGQAAVFQCLEQARVFMEQILGAMPRPEP
jgi:hypothetical protein